LPIPQPASPSVRAPAQITEQTTEIGETDIAGLPCLLTKISQWRTAPKAHGWTEYKRLDSALVFSPDKILLMIFSVLLKDY
jgi:hypothetical protein